MLEHGGRLRRASREYGIPLSDWIDLSTGISPFAWPVPAIPAAAWQRLPEDDDGLLEAAQAYYGTNELLPVAGSQAAIQALPTLRRTSTVGVLAPGYAEHAHAWRQQGHQVELAPAKDLIAAVDRFDALVLIHPNNPGADTFNPDHLRALASRLAVRGGWLVVDEAFIDASPAASLAPGPAQDGLIVLRSVGKFFGMAGARAGFVHASADLLERLRAVLGPWTLSGPSRHALRLALQDTVWQGMQRERLQATSNRLAELLRSHGLSPTAGTAFFQWRRDPDAARLHRALAEHGIFTRLFESPPSLRFGLPADEAQFARLASALTGMRKVSGSTPSAPSASSAPDQPTRAPAGQATRRRGRVLMVQGCTSDAGKSTVVAALCRWARRRGIDVAPFKPQNMALNSAVTVDGGEIGRAQAVQAQAAGLAPHTDFNPVLLKPTTDRGAQVIIHGHAIGNMDARHYHEYKRIAFEAVLASHERLVARHGLVLVEGAGSPAEINLRDRDIANMGFAEEVDCPVILVADIDRGGVFAHLVGTLAVLSPSERERIKGFVINRFRGDISLLQPGLDWLERETGKPVLGVLPYLHGLHLEAEDAVARENVAAAPRQLRVVVPVLPRISNHTDFDALRAHPEVDLRFVPLADTPPPCDLIVLPGSKSTRADLQALRGAGWDTHLAGHLRYGGRVLGICGGLQMLGRAVHDPAGVEGEAGSTEGLGWLDIETRLAPTKQLHNVTGRLTLADAEVTGYEIHCGTSEGEGFERPFARLEDGRIDGACSVDGRVAGTYLHGVFDRGPALSALLAWAGLHDARPQDMQALREASLERLADLVDTHLDTARLLHVAGLAEVRCAV